MNNKRLLKTFEDNNLDVIYSTSEQMRLWYTGLKASAGFLFVEKEEATLLIDSRYIELAEKTAKNVSVILFKKDELKTFASEREYKRIGVEKEYMTLSEREALDTLFPDAEIVLISGAELRIIKDEEEIALMRKAGNIAMTALKELSKDIVPGVTELELDRKLEFLLRKHGAEKGSFDAIVVSGANGSLPHGKPSSKELKDGELLTIDFGAIWKGYCSDITRTFHVGTVTDEKLLEIEAVLTEAQKRGKEAVKPGVTTVEIDKICRDYITEKGYGEFFVHSTGHGLGIDVHELPNVTSNVKFSTVLEAGMVITVEPGIYIPNFGGIRIEDDVLVTSDGYEILSK